MPSVVGPIRKSVLFLIAPLFLAVFFAPEGAMGQMESMRFELGRRLTRFERAWEDASPSQRAACVDSMDRAVRSFFGLQLDTAALLLDRATQDVQELSPETSTTWLAVNRCSIDFENPWIDPSGGALRFRLRQIAGENGSNPAPSDESKTGQSRMGRLRLSIQDRDQTLATGEWQELVPLFKTEGTVDHWHTWQLPPLPEGDYQVSATCITSEGDFDLIAEGVSISRNLEARMVSVAAWYEENRRGKGDTALSTARWLARELKQGEKGQPTEIDIPWNTWLRDFEFLRDQNANYLSSISQAAPRSYWLQLSDGVKSQIVRLGVPKPLSERIPVLFAFHGAGGSENMFFETYGAGRLVEMATDRGWLVVSPRQSLNGLGMDIDAMLDAIEPWFPIDRSRVMLVGHSMGAAQAIAQVSAHSDRVRAVAALGGGGLPRSSLRSSPVRFFVAAGDRDFGRPRAKSLADSLRGLGCEVAYREYADVEHMVIVQAALPDVFTFLDQSGE